MSLKVSAICDAKNVPVHVPVCPRKCPCKRV